MPGSKAQRARRRRRGAAARAAFERFWQIRVLADAKRDGVVSGPSALIVALLLASLHFFSERGRASGEVSLRGG